MSRTQLIASVFEELERARCIHPDWPHNIFEQLVIVGEEYGELQQATLQEKWEDGYFDHIQDEAIQLAAMSLRLLFNLDKTYHRNK